MGQRDPLKLYPMWRKLPTLARVMKQSDQPPYIGVTQGGSTRPNQPAKVAATDGEWKPDTKFKL
jgi:cytochrome bd-type quinol oxidase subunit 1